MVFSSIGDTTRVCPLQNAVRSGLPAAHPLRSTVSGASTLARSLFATIFLVDRRMSKAFPTINFLSRAVNK